MYLAVPDRPIAEGALLYDKPYEDKKIGNGADGIACWFIDTDYNEESFFVRHAYCAIPEFH